MFYESGKLFTGFRSGGGFSARFQQRPHAAWQKAHVAAYLAAINPSTLPPKDAFDPEGRATPDVSVLGEGFQVSGSHQTLFLGGSWVYVIMLTRLTNMFPSYIVASSDRL